MAAIETALTRLLGIEHPVLLAPMGSAAGGRLAAAVTNAGGLGMIGSGYADAGTVRNELAEAGNTRVGVGFILWALEKNPEAVGAGGDQTEQTRVFDIVRGAPWPAIYPGRALRNQFSARWNGRENELAADQAEQEKAYLAAASDDFATRVIWAGEGVDLIDDV